MHFQYMHYPSEGGGGSEVYPGKTGCEVEIHLVWGSMHTHIQTLFHT